MLGNKKQNQYIPKMIISTEIKKLRFKYDKVADVLYASSAFNGEVKYTEPEDGVVIRLSKISEEPIGFTIVHFKKRVDNGMLDEIPFFGKVKIPHNVYE